MPRRHHVLGRHLAAYLFSDSSHSELTDPPAMATNASKPNIVERITGAAQAHFSIALLLASSAFVSWVFIPELIKTQFRSVSEIAVLFAAFGLFGSLLGQLFLFHHIKSSVPQNRVCRLLVGTLQLGTILGTLYFLPVYLREHGPCVPGAMFERSSYQSRLYVNIKNEDDEATYHVPALIECGWDSFDDEEESHSWRVYRLVYAEMPDGDRAEPDTIWEELGLDHPGEFTDEDGQRWTVELTNQPAP